jgi:hypothetical protein
MATKTKNTHYLDLSPLSVQARQELLDFYQYLLERYGKQQHSNKPLPEIFYKPVKIRAYQKFNREEIYYAR